MTAISDASHCSPATITRIADAVAYDMRCLKLGLTPTIEVSYMQTFEPDDESQPFIEVVPQGVEYLPLDRAANKLHAEIDVRVSKRCMIGNRQEIDVMMRFVEDLADAFRLKRLDAFVAARCIKVVQQAMNDASMSRRNRFAVRLVLTFEMAV